MWKYGVIMSALPHEVVFAIEGKIVQSQTIRPSKACLHHVLSAFSSLPICIVTVLLVKIASFEPTAIGSLNPLLRERHSLVKGCHLVYYPIIRGPNIRRIPLLSRTQL